MATSVNAGGRLDRLPIGPFHRRILILIGIGMFFDGFDIYLAGTVLGVTLKTGFSTLPQNAVFISATFVGMMLGSFGTGFLGDRYGRRFTYQFNLLLFGLASLAAAFAPTMMVSPSRASRMAAEGSLYGWSGPTSSVRAAAGAARANNNKPMRIMRTLPTKKARGFAPSTPTKGRDRKSVV